MGRDSTIYIQSEDEKVIKPSRIIDALLFAGWSFDDHGRISYNVSEDLAQWERKSLDEWPLVSSLLDTAYLRENDVGLSLTVGGEASGGDFLFHPKKRALTISPTINRKEIASKFRISDYSWYLSRLLKPDRVFGIYRNLGPVQRLLVSGSAVKGMAIDFHAELTQDMF